MKGLFRIWFVVFLVLPTSGCNSRSTDYVAVGAPDYIKEAHLTITKERGRLSVLYKDGKNPKIEGNIVNVFDLKFTLRVPKENETFTDFEFQWNPELSGYICVCLVNPPGFELLSPSVLWKKNET